MLATINCPLQWYAIHRSCKKGGIVQSIFRTVYSIPFVEGSYSFIDVVNPNLYLCIKTTADEVKEILQNLDITKATGADNVPARILKACSEELSTPLALLFNRSFSLGRVPEQWELANISPVFKANERDLVENNRSISVLSIQGKCQERIVHTAIYSLIGSMVLLKGDLLLHN